ncbi:hypothetical protein [Microbulbifer sp. A4B17]|uniref:hypothetical protein n=1 Tax=Microbulbifer sp. A4B17 TaxID=359370 RepID=UPI001300B48A|nr:hypothetical protein [Microbulbifer sp. A4B17]
MSFEQKMYNSPESELCPEGKKRVKLGSVLSILGAFLQTPIFVFFCLGVLSFWETFQVAQSLDTSPEVMAGMMSHSLSNFVIGGLLSTPGLLISCAALFLSSFRNKWLFWYSLILSLIWIISFPFGTLFGLIYLLIIFIKRKS